MSRTEANGLPQIHANILNRKGFFVGFVSGDLNWTSNYFGNNGTASIQVSTRDTDKYLRIWYSETDPRTGVQKNYDECKVWLTTTSCRYGGVRYWFECPTWGCHKRVETLYRGSEVFACRHCFNLTYASRNESKRYKGFVSIPDVDALGAKVKREYYAGKPTRKFRRYLKKQDQLLYQMGYRLQELKERKSRVFGYSTKKA